VTAIWKEAVSGVMPMIGAEKSTQVRHTNRDENSIHSKHVKNHAMMKSGARLN
jgi:hypothetical protein